MQVEGDLVERKVNEWMAAVAEPARARNGRAAAAEGVAAWRSRRGALEARAAEGHRRGSRRIVRISRRRPCPKKNRLGSRGPSGIARAVAHLFLDPVEARTWDFGTALALQVWLGRFGDGFDGGSCGSGGGGGGRRYRRTRNI